MIGIAGRHPMWLSNGTVGLLEKRVQASSGIAMSQDVSLAGSEYARTLESDTSIEDSLSLHKNNVNDPATDTLNASQSLSFNMGRVRGLTSNLILVETVHVSLDGFHGESTGPRNMTANETINIGQPVYVSAADTVNLADADTLNTSHVLGLAITDSIANSAVLVLSEGIVERDDWTTIIGSVSLTPGATYYLSTTAGGLTVTPPTGEGDHVVRCGIAVNTTTIDIEVNEVAAL